MSDLEIEIGEINFDAYETPNLIKFIEIPDSPGKKLVQNLSTVNL